MSARSRTHTPAIRQVAVQGRTYRVRMLGAARLKALAIISDADERLIRQFAELNDGALLTHADIGRALAACQRVAKHCVLGVPANQLHPEVWAYLAALALGVDQERGER